MVARIPFLPNQVGGLRLDDASIGDRGVHVGEEGAGDEVNNARHSTNDVESGEIPPDDADQIDSRVRCVKTSALVERAICR